MKGRGAVSGWLGIGGAVGAVGAFAGSAATLAALAVGLWAVLAMAPPAASVEDPGVVAGEVSGVEAGPVGPAAGPGALTTGVGTLPTGPAGPAAPALFADTAVVPLLVVPGWGDDTGNIEPLRKRFVEEGWPSTRVVALAFDDRFGSNEEHAAEIARAVESLLALTDAARVDVVAHSMGGLAVRQYLQFDGGAERVRRVVFLGTPHRGSMAAMLAWGEGGREMVPGSDFLTRLNGDGGGVPEGVEALSIRTPSDLRVIPASSAVLAGALNLEICCPSHHQLLDGEPRVFADVARFLEEGAAGVPSATVPSERVAWTDDRFENRLGAWSLWGEGSWSPWGDGWAEEMIRRWFLPYSSHPPKGDPDGGAGGAKPGGSEALRPGGPGR